MLDRLLSIATFGASTRASAAPLPRLALPRPDDATQGTDGRPARNRATLAAKATPPVAATPAAPAAAPPALLPAPDEDRQDVRNMSPKQLADWAHDMYLGGVLSWNEYKMVGFPAETHPQYNQTVGALTGRPAAPDRQRDMLAEWQTKVDHLQRHPGDPASLNSAQRVLTVMQWQSIDPINLET